MDESNLNSEDLMTYRQAPQNQLARPILFPEITTQSSKNENTIPRSMSPQSPCRPRPKSSQDIRTIFPPSPLFVQPTKRSKDDIHLTSSPVTPKRPNLPSRGLSLQMPPRDISSTSIANLTKRIPLSPQLDPSITYASPSSVLPRRSRGLDFSRACTNLHHSTLAENRSPDSSPTIGGRGIIIPPRKALCNQFNNANAPDSPVTAANSSWSAMIERDRSAISSSLGSTVMMDYESPSTSSDDDDAIGHVEEEDTIHMTPHASRARNGVMNLFGPAIGSSPGGDGVTGFSPAAAKLMSFQRARTKSGPRRKSLGSTSSHGSFHAPRSRSPPLLKSFESRRGGSVPHESTRAIASRRESLSLGTHDLQLSDYEDGDKVVETLSDPLGISTPMTPTMDGRRGVIRRAVTRRTNMMPQTKGFARIKAALQEECAPVDTEVRREAEVIRQVRESDTSTETSLQYSQPATVSSSPSLLAAPSGKSDSMDYIPEDLIISTNELTASRRPSLSAFTSQVIPNSGGSDFRNSLDERTRTPPPPIIVPRGSSSGISDDISMDTPPSSLQSSIFQQQSSLPSKSQHPIVSRSSTPQPSLAAAIDATRKGAKRMRDDDLDPNFFKRRAVSPGMSLQNSPILPQSPMQRDCSWWGGSQTKSTSGRELPSVQVIGERVSSGGSASSGSVSASGSLKRIGFQGMSDTNYGLMNMTID